MNVRAVVMGTLMVGAVVGVTDLDAQVQTRPALVEGVLQTVQGAPIESQPDMDLGLSTAVQMALDNNLDVAVERLNPQTFDLTYASLRANYLPVLSSVFGQNNAVQLPTSQLIGGQRVQNDNTTYNFGVSQSVPWKGGSLAMSWNNRRQESTSAFNTFNPQYNSTFAASYTQPLLRNFGEDPLRTQLVVTQINRDISEIQLRTTITNTLASVRNAYWDLVVASDAVRVARSALDLADKLVEDNKVRVEVGTLAPIDVVQAEAEAANRRLTLTQVEATRQTAELALKRLIVSGTDDPVWQTRLNLTDHPTLINEPIDIQVAIRNALEKRTDLAQSRRQLDANNLNVDLLRNQKLPSVDLVASYALQGIGGTRFERSSGIGGTILNTIPGGYADALSALSNRTYPNWNVQLQISYPVGQSQADASFARARITLQQNQAQIKALELQVATEVTNIALTLQSNRQRVDAARAARELAERRLEAEQSKFEVGLSTNFFVVQAQRDLLDAQGTELRAILDHQKSLVDFERVQETSLSRAGITLVTLTNVGAITTANTANTGTTTGTGGTGQTTTGTRTQ